MTSEAGKGSMTASVKALAEKQPESGVWHANWRIEKYHDGIVDGSPDEVLEVEGNILVNVGIIAMLSLLALNTGTAYTTNTNAHLAAGSNVAAADPTDTDLGTLLGAREVATAVVSNQTVTFQATFAAAQATGLWKEVGAFSALTGVTMLNHLVSDLGEKFAGSAWVLTLAITIS